MLAAWLAGLGPAAAARPPPSIGRAIAGTGGVLAAGGVIGVGAEQWVSTGSAAPAGLLAAAVLGVAVAAIVRTPPPVAVAGVGASGVAAPALAFFACAGGGLPSLRLVGLLAAVLLAGLYGAGPWRGHSFHLAILASAGWVVAVTLGNLGTGRPLLGGFATVGEALSTAGTASMVLAVVYLGLGSWLHDEGLEGVATPFLGVAAVALPIGAVGVVRDAGGVVPGLVTLAAGAAVALVGGRCRRRGTTWIGLAAGVLGLLQAAAAVTDRPALTAAVVAAAGVGLVLLAPVAAAAAREPPTAAPSPPTGDNEPTPPPTPR